MIGAQKFINVKKLFDKKILCLLKNHKKEIKRANIL